MSGSGPTSFRVTIRNNAVAALLAAGTLAGANIFTSRDAELTTADLPALLLYTGRERKLLISKAGAAPMFDATCTLHVVARVFAKGTDGPFTAETQLDCLVDQVQAALLSAPAFMVPDLREVAGVDIDMKWTSEEGTVGEAVLAFHCVYTDQYPPCLPDELTTIVTRIAYGTSAITETITLTS